MFKQNQYYSCTLHVKILAEYKGRTKVFDRTKVMPKMNFKVSRYRIPNEVAGDKGPQYTF